MHAICNHFSPKVFIHPYFHLLSHAAILLSIHPPFVCSSVAYPNLVSDIVVFVLKSDVKLQPTSRIPIMHFATIHDHDKSGNMPKVVQLRYRHCYWRSLIGRRFNTSISENFDDLHSRIAPHTLNVGLLKRHLSSRYAAVVNISSLTAHRAVPLL